DNGGVRSRLTTRPFFTPFVMTVVSDATLNLASTYGCWGHSFAANVVHCLGIAYRPSSSSSSTFKRPKRSGSLSRRIPDTRIPDCRSPRNHHARADADAAIQVHNVCVIHADAAVRHESADRARRIGAVDRIFTAGQRHGRRSHRVMRGAACNDARQRTVVLPH